MARGTLPSKAKRRVSSKKTKTTTTARPRYPLSLNQLIVFSKTAEERFLGLQVLHTDEEQLAHVDYRHLP